MRTKETKYLTHKCVVTYSDTHGIMFKGVYLGEDFERWFFLSNNSTLDGARPKNWDSVKQETGYNYSYAIGLAQEAKLMASEVTIHYPHNISKSAFSTEAKFVISELDDDKPLFKQVILRPNKIKD